MMMTENGPSPRGIDGQAVRWVTEDILGIKRHLGGFLGQFNFSAAVVAHPQGIDGVAIKNSSGVGEAAASAVQVGAREESVNASFLAK